MPRYYQYGAQPIAYESQWPGWPMAPVKAAPDALGNYIAVGHWGAQRDLGQVPDVRSLLLIGALGLGAWWLYKTEFRKNPIKPGGLSKIVPKSVLRKKAKKARLRTAAGKRRQDAGRQAAITRWRNEGRSEAWIRARMREWKKRRQ